MGLCHTLWYTHFPVLSGFRLEHMCNEQLRLVTGSIHFLIAELGLRLNMCVVAQCQKHKRQHAQ